MDDTFHWVSVNGMAVESRFSMLMFRMPKHLPIYFHCLAQICRHDEDCTMVNNFLANLSRRIMFKLSVI